LSLSLSSSGSDGRDEQAGKHLPTAWVMLQQDLEVTFALHLLTRLDLSPEALVEVEKHEGKQLICLPTAFAV